MSGFCDPMDCSPPGSSVLGISQARIPEWVAFSFSRGSIFLTQGLNLGLLHLRQTPILQGDSLLTELQGKPNRPGVGLIQGDAAAANLENHILRITALKCYRISFS